MPLNKETLFHKVIEKLESTLAILIDSALQAKEASTNEESKAENKYDTRGLEASYLASGQAQRVKELKESIFNLKKVKLRNFDSSTPAGVSALIKVSIDEKEKKWLFLLPASGVSVESPDGTIQTLTLEAPLGKALFQCYLGDSFEYKNMEYEIIEIL